MTPSDYVSAASCVLLDEYFVQRSLLLLQEQRGHSSRGCNDCNDRCTVSVCHTFHLATVAMTVATIAVSEIAN